MTFKHIRIVLSKFFFMKNFKIKLSFLPIILCFIPLLYAQNLTIATYNVRVENTEDSLKGSGWDLRSPFVTRVISSHDFDIVGTQEVTLRQIHDILTQLTDYDYTGSSRDKKQSGQFDPIFYKKNKLHLVESGHFWLSETEDKPSIGWDAQSRRICTWGKFEVKETGSQFWFFNVHMDHKGQIARLKSTELILNKIKAMCANDPVIFAGDFNADQNSEPYQLVLNSGTMKDSYLVANILGKVTGTFNKFNPNTKSDQRIDLIFVNDRFQVMRYEVLTDSYRDENKERVPSDHYPVQIQVQLDGNL